MALHLVMFRLKADRTYGERYASLVDVVNALAETKWSEATASYLIWFDGAPGKLLQTLVTGSKVYRDNKDMIVVIDMATRERAFIGVEKPGQLDFLLGLRSPAALRQSAVGAALQARGRF